MNEKLAEFPPLTRILFEGLWTIADRAGRLEDRPKWIKAQTLPYDEHDVEAALQALHDGEFIQRYAAGKERYIQIVNFLKHQNPHKNEAPSTIPAPEQHRTSTVQAPTNNGTTPADSLFIDSLSSDSLQEPVSTASRFDEFRKLYPKKVERKKAEAIWKSRKLDRRADEILAALTEQIARDQNWKAGFIPNPTTYLNGDRWEDAIDENRTGTTRHGTSGGTVRETAIERNQRKVAERERAIIDRTAGSGDRSLVGEVV